MLNPLNFLRQTLLDKGVPSYSRLFALPFFMGSFGISLADGIISLHKGQSALDAAASLALTGMTLFTGSKYLSIHGAKVAAGAAQSAATAASKESEAEG